MIFVVSSKDLPLASLITVEFLKVTEEVNVKCTEEAKLIFDGIQFDSDVSVCRYLARSFSKYYLYGSSPLQYLEVDHWLSFGIGPLQNTTDFESSIGYLDRELSTITYLVGNQITIADIFIWSILARSGLWDRIQGEKGFLNVYRWYSFIGSHTCITESLKLEPIAKSMSSNKCEVASSTERKEEGKFIELPGAEQGKVIVRFPPEASGYLHIGHAKAALLNQYYKDKFEGKLIMRFDDTNPAKEKVDFEKVILEDLELLQIKPDIFTHTSDYFDLMLKYCEKLIKEGKAYVDDTDPETMKLEREKKAESTHRNNKVADNMKMWQAMLAGTEYGVKCCVRAKIDMNSANGCLRDPTIYRCKVETHPKTGNKYKVYPTYDFACPIVDSIEGVTHCLRTTEYHDRDDQFYWFIDALGLRKPYIWEYSRLNMTNTVLSKRKLTWFVEEGYVDAWDDPRFPTVRGIIRRGMTVSGLKQFIVAQGSSRSVVSMEWDKIWAFNKKVIDPIAPRYNALESSGTVPVFVEGVKTEKLLVAKHPKNDDVGKKWIWKSNKILIDHIDAEALKENENTTFINWGNLLIKKINRTDKKITSIEAAENLSNTDYKKTVKLTWLSELEEAPFIPCICVYFDHLITKPVLARDEDFKQFLNPNTKIEVKMVGDPELMHVKRGDIIQLQRRGFYICDQEYRSPSIYTSNGCPIILFFIPDGHSKETPITAQSKKEIQNEVKLKSEGKVKKDQPSDQKKKDTKTPESTANTQSTSFDIAEATKLLESIKAQGDRVRQCKTDKCEKNVIDDEVNVLLQLKKSFESLTNIKWKPDITPEKISVGSSPKSSSSENKPSQNQSQQSSDLYTKVCLQASKIRCMQAKKADKNLINTELTVLADLKERFKQEIGKPWSVAGDVNIDTYYDEYTTAIHNKVTAQGDRVRQLKSAKASKSAIDLEVKKLLELKAEYKEVTGSEYKPLEKPVETQNKDKGKETMSDKGKEVHEKIVEQGNKIRQLKTEKSAKEVIDTEVKVLLALKDEFKKATGTAWTPNMATGSGAATPANATNVPVKKDKIKPEKVDKPKKEQQKPQTESGVVKKQTRLGLEARKDENLPDWYTQVITKSELIEYYDVSGCYTLRPWAFSIWKIIRGWFDEQITNLGVDECYFPIFVSKSALEREKAHIADFSPEVAWVTKSGDSELEEPVAIRPTSETVMYPAFAKWIRSHRDLPLKLNQWNNVVRWEFKHPQPFLRTREFLWQEGHTAYSNKKDAEDEVYVILDLYARVYTDLLAIPVIKGRKTEKEKFAGGDFTTTVEAYISASGRAIQGATSHHLGQNFSLMFDITFEDPETKEKKFVFQNSWGLTTRTIGVMVMVHADDQGLVLPPKVAKIQVAIVPCGITASLGAEDRNALDQSCVDLEKSLNVAGVRVKYDSRDNYSSGWKFNHWELKGVPIRVELGPKDMKQNQVVAVRRDSGEKLTLKRDTLVSDIKKLLTDIQQALYNKAEIDLKSHTVICEDWSQFNEKLNEKNIILSPFCGDMDCEDKIKKDSTRNEGVEPGALAMGAKSLCIPFDQPKEISASSKCIHPDCKNQAKFYTLFGRSY